MQKFAVDEKTLFKMRNVLAIFYFHDMKLSSMPRPTFNNLKKELGEVLLGKPMHPEKLMEILKVLKIENFIKVRKNLFTKENSYHLTKNGLDFFNEINRKINKIPKDSFRLTPLGRQIAEALYFGEQAKKKFNR